MSGAPQPAPAIRRSRTPRPRSRASLARVVDEVRRAISSADLGQRDPGLDAEQAVAVRAQRRVGAFGMRDAAPGCHPVHVAWDDRLFGAEAVPMQDLAVEQVGDGCQADMRVRPNVQPRPARNSPGPIWSKKMKGPTICRSFAGRARRTSKPPTSCARGRITSSTPLGAAGQSGSASGSQLMVAPPSSIDALACVGFSAPALERTAGSPTLCSSAPASASLRPPAGVYHIGASISRKLSRMNRIVAHLRFRVGGMCWQLFRRPRR